MADRDADDAIALLDSVFQLISEADESRVVTYGMSRGGNVSLHVGMRDERIGAVVNLFGATDFFLFQADAEDLVASGGEGGTGTLRELMSSVVDPFLDGELALAEARMALLFRSPLYFADDLPILQMDTSARCFVALPTNGIKDCVEGYQQQDNQRQGL